ncbi:hypothetical protein [Nonomuraea soli]|uniref:PH domain-containing protein n=1 Tax=Nonomuraea soli TaxID=1032476 RepID=A0A7W0CMT5_9ACTN|nr:hypothetical protein [Nonomuraea soli]MBA2894088.1 hypothetical protein [Nonomuraea soli]
MSDVIPVAAVGLLAASLLLRMTTELRRHRSWEDLPLLRQSMAEVDVEGTEVEVVNKPVKAAFVWLPLLMLLVVTVLIVFQDARTATWGRLPFDVLVLLGLGYGTARKVSPGPVLVMNSAGVVFPRHGVSLTWGQVKEVRLVEVARHQRALNGDESVVAFLPRDTQAVTRRMRGLTRLAAVTARNAYGSPLAILVAPLDLGAEEIAVVAEKYAGRTNLVTDAR